uniref:Uncharacterized protein n=1 Tax=Arundo donax TaxID=35708 RepID=A0A0A8YB96_ARUDO
MAPRHSSTPVSHRRPLCDPQLQFAIPPVTMAPDHRTSQQGPARLWGISHR